MCTLILLLALLGLIVIYAIDYRLNVFGYKVINPVSVLTIIWFVTLLIHRLYFGVAQYTSITYFCIMIGIICFACGFWITEKFHFSFFKQRKIEKYNMVFFKKLVIILTVLELLRVFYVLILVLELAGSLDVFIYNSTYVRRLYLSRSDSLLSNIFEFFLNANAMIGYVIIPIYAINKSKKKWGIVVFWVMLELLFALITMSKMSFILFLIILISSYLGNLGDIRTQKKKIKKIIPILVLGVALFLILIGLQRNYGQFGDSIVMVVLKKAVFYLTSSVEALGKYMSLYESDVEGGRNIFIIISRILERLHIISSSGVLSHAEFIDIKYESTNVYSWFRTFYLDFSYAGYIIGPIIIGTIMGCIYNPNRNRISNQICNAWIIGTVAMSFYTYLWGQTIYVFVLVYAVVLEFVLGKWLYCSENNSR